MSILSLVPMVWAVVATLLWRRRLDSPFLFLVTALLMGLGAQALSELLWLAWAATRNSFVALPAAEAWKQQVQVAGFQVVATGLIVVPMTWRLSKRL